MITSEFLHEVALLTDQKVTKVVINSGLEITDFEIKSVTGGFLAMQYIVPAGSVPVVTLIELQNAAGDVLSTNAVNVPIESDTLILQSIEVKEV